MLPRIGGTNCPARRKWRCGMRTLSENEWQVLSVIARNLLATMRVDEGIAWVSDTLIEEEVNLLKKIAG